MFSYGELLSGGHFDRPEDAEQSVTVPNAPKICPLFLFKGLFLSHLHLSCVA